MLYFSRDTRLVTTDRKPDFSPSYRDGKWIRNVWFSFRNDVTCPSRKMCCFQLHCKLQVRVCDVSFCYLCQRTLVRRQTRQRSLKKYLFSKNLCLTVYSCSSKASSPTHYYCYTDLDVSYGFGSECDVLWL